MASSQVSAAATTAELDAYVAEQEALSIDLRDCALEAADSTTYGEEVNDGAEFKRARVRVPKSG